jgi:long-chain fatty acid transport protein
MKKYLSVVLSMLFVIVASVFMVSTSVYATDGMNLEGYGPIATGMGGASMAYDNGTAAMMNNPATLGLMPQGNRLDVALGLLGPHITASAPGAPDSKSSADAFYMPAFGWVQKAGLMSYGVGVFAQGGMGAEYDANSFLAAGSGEEVRSELGVGRLLVPFAYEVNKDFTLAATVDYVWASLDLKMALPGAAFVDMAAFPGSTQTNGTVSGSMMDAFGSLVFGGGAFPAGTLNPSNPVNWGRFDFSDKSAFTGAAKGTGFAGKLGGVYKVNKALTVGLAYHSKTALGDLETTGATVSFNANVDSGIAGGGAPNGVYVPATIPLNGKIQVKDFEWPQMAGAGVAYQASDDLLVVFDYKWINWADVMKSFKLTFTADAAQPNPLAQAGFGGTVLDATLFQDWKDQHVFMIGAGYKVNPEWTLRAGLNYTNNPIPDKFMNPLFPAIEKTHVTLGAGYMICKTSSVDASFTYAPEVKQTNGQGVTVAHYQTNAQLMYSYRF